MIKDKESAKRDQYTVVLEDLRSNFKVFGESLDFVRKDVKGVKEDLSIVKKDIKEIKKEAEETKKDIKEIKGDVEIMKTELSMIRHNQITRDEFRFLETRVANLERKLK